MEWGDDPGDVWEVLTAVAAVLAVCAVLLLVR